ncbi:MAG: terminase small subunit [Dehalococcoidia bacterium]|nr:terminase small subunit [Dehalococcoidia bacterium]MDP7160686.1 terminase small subunit [Dehalococcoidia bacterium]MDP7513560.1 terminase small subunit [Dehalococcoidia bacterium]
MTSTSLTLRRQKFVSEYVETGNATQAATLAGYSRSGARVAGVLRTWQRFESIGPLCVSRGVAYGLRGQ